MFDAFLAQVWPLALVMAGVGYWAHVTNRRRHRAQVDKNTANAKAHDMAYAAPGGAGEGGPLRGVYHFEGTQMELFGKPRHCFWPTRTRAAPDSPGPFAELHPVDGLHRRDGFGHTGSDEFAGRRHGSAAGARRTDGRFISALTEKAAQAAFQLFLRVTFGNERAGNILPLAPQHRLPLESDTFGNAFVAFSDRPELMTRLDPSARELLLNERDRRVAFLWDAAGLTLTWPEPLLSPQDIAERAVYGAALAKALRR